jgi:uncharacterized membrane protein YiaA
MTWSVRRITVVLIIAVTALMVGLFAAHAGGSHMPVAGIAFNALD